MFRAVRVVLIIEPALGDEPPVRSIDHQLLEDVSFPLGSEAVASELRGGDVDVVDAQGIDNTAYPRIGFSVGLAEVVGAVETDDGIAGIRSEAVEVGSIPRRIDPVEEVLVGEDVKLSSVAGYADLYLCQSTSSGSTTLK